MLRYLKSWLRNWETRAFNRRIRRALDLHSRGEVRSDGLPLKSASSSLELEWHARDIHPWDKARHLKNPATQFFNQAINDTEAVLARLFAALPHIDIIILRVYEPSSDRLLMSGEVSRISLTGPRPLSDRMWLCQLGIRFHVTDIQPIALKEQTQ